MSACPKCKGVPEYPDVEGCRGCIACDFTGTRTGYQQMQRIMKEGYEEMRRLDDEHREYIKRGVCSRCGACSQEEASTKCRPSSVGDTGEWSCPAEGMWEEEQPTPPAPPLARDGA